ncbi:hypothetical protein D0Z07_3633 [Hyphodiscus hymeniophilus]|uniref:Uncharacterized protein n=1 Tax=Hyphodiscus hymeniophilus TaxID=353542 RepID=A0A9P6VLM6_9HELO|nr:hypothetical protein D0Z07_3633 [Hyphodiscus hymeniophilus]
MLLAAFEIVGGDSTASWTVHIDGGAAMLKYFKPHGPHVRMLVQFCLSTCVKCITKGEPGPTSIVEWCNSQLGYISRPEQHAFPLVGMVCRLVTIYSAFKKGSYVGIEETMVEELLSLESELDVWESQVPENWTFTIESTTDDVGETMYLGQYHVYQELWTARLYTNYRWARILVNELIWLNISKLPLTEENGRQQRRSLEVVSNMATDIICSISTFFRQHTTSSTKRQNLPPVSAVFLLLFPVAVAGGAIGVSQELHDWAIKILSIIGNTFGTKGLRERWGKGEMDLYFDIA